MRHHSGTIQFHSPAPPLSVGFGESVDTCRDHQLVIPDLPLQEGLQLVDVHLRDNRPRGNKHAEHRMDAVQRHAVQVCQHGLNVSPEQLRKQRTGAAIGCLLHCVCVWVSVCVCVCLWVSVRQILHLQLLLPLLWLGGGVGVSLLIAVNQHHASLNLLFGWARLHHTETPRCLLSQHAVLLPQCQLSVHELLWGAQFRTELLHGPWTCRLTKPVSLCAEPNLSKQDGSVCIWGVTFFLKVQDDGGVDGRDGEVGEGAILQLHIQSDWAQVRLPAQRPHSLKHRTNSLHLFSQKMAAASRLSVISKNIYSLWETVNKAASLCDVEHNYWWAAGELHLEFLVAVRVGLHGLRDEGRELQLLLLQWRPELRRQDDGWQGERRLLPLAQLRLLLADVTVDPPRVCHILTGVRRQRDKGSWMIFIMSTTRFNLVMSENLL